MSTLVSSRQDNVLIHVALGFGLTNGSDRIIYRCILKGDYTNMTTEARPNIDKYRRDYNYEQDTFLGPASKSKYLEVANILLERKSAAFFINFSFFQKQYQIFLHLFSPKHEVLSHYFSTSCINFIVSSPRNLAVQRHY